MDGRRTVVIVVLSSIVVAFAAIMASLSLSAASEQVKIARAERASAVSHAKHATYVVPQRPWTPGT